eukprot:NODE_5803_length_675_cov_3.859425_g4910_i0.p2 GENE.NODE_5803_length_675_cov_3.859425_g4910_i0~~NODE_5803_length_675_cov_3.859425_g4910_i0.p2  ORF type:complete len:54 (-),score=2.05 NODE_5803_length_675_cov_3.859425_g4910_i0:306-467(-)
MTRHWTLTAFSPALFMTRHWTLTAFSLHGPQVRSFEGPQVPAVSWFSWLISDS